MRFEIQIRTVLQHAWAEIEHDRSYKLATKLPKHLRRRFNLISGMLEVADREFGSLAKEIDEYRKEISSKAKRGKISIKLDSDSLTPFLEKQLSKFDQTKIDISRPLDSQVIQELLEFGITTLKNLYVLFTRKAIESTNENLRGATWDGVLRYLMMFNEIDSYFSKCWNGSWVVMDPDSLKGLLARYGKKKIDQVHDRYKLHNEPKI